MSELSKLEQQVLDVVTAGRSHTAQGIARILKRPVAEVDAAIARLLETDLSNRKE
jgi:hypothetical protein